MARLTIALACAVGGACGSSPSAPSASTNLPAGNGLVFGNLDVSARLSSPTLITYLFCYSVSPATADIAEMTLTAVDYTMLGPAGDIYGTHSDSNLIGLKVGLGRGGCFFSYDERNVTRPVATTYRITYQFASAQGSRPVTQTVTGSISSSVPPQPFITKVTLTHDFPSQQLILFQPRPITFTASVEGGMPPFLYRWNFSSTVMRDWDPNPVFVWDGRTVGGNPFKSGDSYVVVVSVRRSTWPVSELGASTNLFGLFGGN